MKQKSVSIAGILFLAIAFLITSCSKTGPAGAAGATGATGATGPAGAPGATGATGTANVIYSPWLNVTFGPTGFDTNYLATIVAPKLVDSIVNHGDIKVYWNAGNDSTGNQFVLALPIYEPFLFGSNTQPVTLIANPYFYTQTIGIISNNDLSSYVDGSGYNNFQFRYILIPGGVTALPVSVSGTKGSSINWNDYKQVKAYLGLKD